MAITIQKLITPIRIAAGQENPLGCGDSNCCRFIKRCSGIRISLMRDEFHGLLKIVAKAESNYLYILDHARHRRI